MLEEVYIDRDNYLIDYLHIECNHMGSIHPTMHGIVIRGLKAGPSRVDPQQILLSKPRAISSPKYFNDAINSNV